MSKRKIIQVIATLKVGGAEGQLFEFVKRIDKRKYDIIVCALTEGGYYADELERLGIKIVVLNKRGKLDIGMLIKLVRLMRIEKIELVYTYMFTANTWGRIAALLAGVPIIVAGERAADRWKSKFHLLVDKVLSKYTDKIIANSDGVVDFYVLEAKISRNKFLVVHNGVNMSMFKHQKDRAAEIRQELNICSEKAVVGTIGRLMPQKGYQFFLKAVKIIAKEFPNTVFLIVGVGYELEELENLSIKLGIGDKVIFAGFRDDIPEILSIVDVFVSSSLYEGLPNVVLEAMANGLPVVATNIEGTCEVVLEGKTGFLVPPRDYVALAEKVTFLLNNQELAHKMGETGKEKVREEFGFDIMVRKIEGIYDDLFLGKGISGS